MRDNKRKEKKMETQKFLEKAFPTGKVTKEVSEVKLFCVELPVKFHFTAQELHVDVESLRSVMHNRAQEALNRHLDSDWQIGFYNGEKPVP
jgi:hypothetical protein